MDGWGADNLRVVSMDTAWSLIHVYCLTHRGACAAKRGHVVGFIVVHTQLYNQNDRQCAGKTRVTHAHREGRQEWEEQEESKRTRVGCTRTHSPERPSHKNVGQLTGWSTQGLG